MSLWRRVSDPATWTVRHQEETLLEGRPVVVVHLSCCHLGDRAYFDRTSGQLVRYELGPR